MLDQLITRADAALAAGDHVALGEACEAALALGKRQVPATVAQQLAARLGHARVALGKRKQAARAYASGVEGPDAGLGRELAARAAIELLLAGELGLGRAALERAFALHGVRLERNAVSAIAAVAVQRARLALGWPTPATRPPEPAVRELLELSSQASFAFVMLDGIYGIHCHTRHLDLALRQGDARHRLRAISAEVVFSGSRGWAAASRTQRLLIEVDQRARALDPRDASIAALWRHAAHGMSNFFLSRYDVALSDLDQALARADIEAPAVEVMLATFAVWCRVALLRVGELRASLPALRERAKARDMAQLDAVLSVDAEPYLLAGADQPKRAASTAIAEAARWPEEVQQIHMSRVVVQCQSELYQGRDAEAFACIEGAWPRLRRESYLLIQIARVELHYLRGRCALAANALDVARKSLHALAKEQLPWATAVGRLLSAGLLMREGRGGAAARAFDDACERLRAQGLEVHAALAEVVAARAEPSPERVATAERARARLATEGIVEPVRFARMFIGWA